MDPISDYTKEPVSIIEKDNNFSVGDKVKFSDYYLSNYVGLTSLATVEAEVKKMTLRMIDNCSISIIDKPMYMEKYGKQTTYPLVCLFIMFPNDNSLYMCSPFGVNKV
jgi:hypothetical protein